MRDIWAEKNLWSHQFAPGSKAALVGQEAVGVMQPDGEFTLVALADGKAIVKEKLEAEGSLLGIFLMRTANGYLLVTNTAARHEPNVSVQPIPPAPNNLVSGRVYAFDAATGKKQWPAPVEVAQQGLLLSQPSDLPVLVLARQIVRHGAGNPREPKVSLMCIDKRTGQVVYRNDELPGSTIANFEVVGDPAARTVTISLPMRTIKLTFTEEPAEAANGKSAQISPAGSPVAALTQARGLVER
jgi:hypothetical protein